MLHIWNNVSKSVSVVLFESTRSELFETVDVVDVIFRNDSLVDEIRLDDTDEFSWRVAYTFMSTIRPIRDGILKRKQNIDNASVELTIK